ncbi:MAG TPA: hypothetical protein VHB79_33185 [Polyangiaceae bacterium]|nr:hypothetical protein [Polyangiaceae bacterium]
MFELRAARLLSLALSSAALFGCASTSGRDWLDSPLDAQAQPALEATTMPSEPAPEARPRLSHTVTLGESYDTRSSSVALVGDASPVQVNVHTQVPVIVNNYGGYGAYGFGYGGYGYGGGYGVSVRGTSSTSRATHTTEAKVGADFPAVPDYGPRAMK